MSLPPLHKFLLDHCPEAQHEPFYALGKAKQLLVDGAALASILYPPPLDSVLPQWKELRARVQLFVDRLEGAGFRVVVFFGVPKAEQQNVEVKKRLLLERSQLVQRTLNAINAGARLPEDVYYTPIRLIKSALVKAFQSIPGVTVVVTETEVNRAVSSYCLGKEKEIFAFAGADISESLLFPIHALCSLHPAAFHWEVFWKGTIANVLVIRRPQVHRALAPQAALPVFGTLVGNPLFPRNRLEGFFRDETTPAEIFTASKEFVNRVLEEEPQATIESFAKQVFARLTAAHDYGAFLSDFNRSCLAYTISDGDQVQEIPFEMVNKSRLYFFEPGLESPSFVPAMVLLQPLRLRTLNLKFGAMTFAEILAVPGGLCSTDFISLPTPPDSVKEVNHASLLDRLELFERLSEVDLAPLLTFDEKYTLTQRPASEQWLYLTTAAMGALPNRACFIRRDELQLLVAQFVTLPTVETHDLPKGALTLERAALCHLFHATLSHLSRLNMVCGAPFPMYNEWEMFDGAVAALSLVTLMELPDFVNNRDRYDSLLAMIETNLPQPLLDAPSPAPSDAQLRRPRPEIPSAAEYRATGKAEVKGLEVPAPSSPLVVRVNRTAGGRIFEAPGTKSFDLPQASSPVKEVEAVTLENLDLLRPTSDPVPVSGPSAVETWTDLKLKGRSPHKGPNSHVQHKKTTRSPSGSKPAEGNGPVTAVASETKSPHQKAAARGKWVPKAADE